MHDGFGTMELFADGQVVARRDGVYGPVKAPGGAGLSIGNALRSGGLSCNGEIDEVKIWRLNPRRIEDEFYARPMDRETAECWRRFRRQIEEAFRRHPDCAKQIGRLVQEAVDSFIRQANAQGPETQSRLLRAVGEYNRVARRQGRRPRNGGRVCRPDWLVADRRYPSGRQCRSGDTDECALLAVDPRRADAARLRSTVHGSVARGCRQPRRPASNQGYDDLIA